ncbi:MAG TPA: glycerophosphodiester phosphodiesterase [Rariglobus sp.]|jgi:glycerophosphoryl diester phosphodiesterase|nr:glycerophosphodiester phosphodiesterase [Rariglobus sp.]
MPLSSNAEVVIVAHRGASHDAPENTVASVSLGWSQHADAAEVDVHLTRDGEVVVIHDATLLRTAGRDARVDALTLAEIRRLDAGVWKGAAWRGERVPTLTEVLATVPEGKRIFIELKQAEGLAPALRRVIEASPVMPAQVVLISFEDDILSEAKRALPDCDALFLADVPEEAAEDKMSSLIQFCRTRRFDGLGVSADWPIDAQLMERLRAENLQLNVWTVNDAHRAGELLAAGVTSITTDRPAWLREQLSGGR